VYRGGNEGALHRVHFFDAAGEGTGGAGASVASIWEPENKVNQRQLGRRDNNREMKEVKRKEGRTERAGNGI
jgi:hypothetical protein